MAKIINLADSVLYNIADWRHKAIMFACVNPMGFYVVMGCLLPQYLDRLDKLETLFKEVKARG